MVVLHDNLPYMAGMADSEGARLCTYNKSDGTWVAVKGEEVLRKWRPKGYLSNDPTTLSVLMGLSGDYPQVKKYLASRG